MVKFFEKILKVVLLFLGLHANAPAQNTGQNVVSLITTSSRTITANTSFVSGNLQNVGQTNHTIVLSVTAGVTTSTDVVQVVCEMQASINGSNWGNIGVATTYVLAQTLGVPSQYFCNGYGAYPYIRSNVTFTLVGSNPFSLTFSIGYQGSSIAANNLTDVSGVLNDVQFASVASLVNGGMLTSFISSSSFGLSIAVYGIDIYSDSTSADLELVCITPVGNSVRFRAWELDIQRVQIYGLALRPYFACPSGAALGYVLSGSGATSLGVQFRYE